MLTQRYATVTMPIALFVMWFIFVSEGSCKASYMTKSWLKDSFKKLAPKTTKTRCLLGLLRTFGKQKQARRWEYT